MSRTKKNITKKPDDDDFIRWGIEGMRKSEAEFRECGLTYAWVDPQPVWLSAIHWDFEILKGPEQPCKRIMRFSLIGGGQIRVIEQWKWWQYKDGEKHLSSLLQPFLPQKHFCADASLFVTAHTKDKLIRTNGWISPGQILEMQTAAVAFPNASQEIVDRVAATLRKIGGDDGVGPDPDRFYALLDGSAGCSFCGRPLRDEVSKLIGVGPDCARHNGIPYSMAAANKRLELRRRLLGDEEISI